MNQEAKSLLARVRWLLALFIVGLVVSGVTAFPLDREMDFLLKVRGLDGARGPMNPQGLDQWLLTVHEGLKVT